MIWAKRSLVAQFIMCFFPQFVRTKVADVLLNCSEDNIRWKFLFRSYFQDKESVIPKYSLHTGAVTDSFKTATRTPTRWGAMPMHSPRKEDNSTNNCNRRFQTEMATKWQNLRTAALIDYLIINYITFVTLTGTSSIGYACTEDLWSWLCVPVVN